MSEYELSDRIKSMERNLQRMRLAIIVIAAFFVYEAIGPLPFGRDRVEVKETVKVRELLVVDERGETIAYLGADDDGAGLILDDDAGNRLDARSAVIRLMAPGVDRRVERLRIDGEGVEVHGGAGRTTGGSPHRAFLDKILD